MLAGAVGMGALMAIDPVMFVNPLEIEVLRSLVVGGVAMEAGAIADALVQNRGMGITTRQPAAHRQIIYGEQRVGGVIIYQSTTGSHYDQYNLVIVLAGHECDSILNLYLDGRQVHWQGSGGGWAAGPGGNYFGGNAGGGQFIGPDGQHYDFDTLVYCEARYGNQADGDVIAGLTANDPTWAASGDGAPWVGGCTYVYLKIEYDQAMFPQFPEIKFTMRGKNDIADPRTGTNGYSTNWALIVSDVLQDTTFGVGDVGAVNTDQLIAAANVCDEMVSTQLSDGTTEAQWSCHYHYDTSTAPGDVLETMMPAAQGRLSRIGGQWYIWPAYWTGPSFSWDESALTGEVDWTPTRKFRDLANCVNGTYIAANYPYNAAGDLYDSNGWYDGTIQNNFPFAFQPTNYPQYAMDTLHGYASNALLAEDGNVTLPLEVTQQCCLSITQAQRAAKIALLRNRQQGSGTLPMCLNAMQMQPIDVMQFTFAAGGWTDKNLEITGAGISPSEDENGIPTVRFQVSVQETDPSVYEVNEGDLLTPYDVPSGMAGAPWGVQPPTDVTAVSNSTTALVGADGVVTPRILVSWLPPADVTVTQIILQYQLSGATSWTSAGSVDNSVSSAYISGVVSGQTYNVQIAALNASGSTSDWVEVTGVAVSAPSSITNSYTNSPQFDLTQPSATEIAMGEVSVTFGGNVVTYAARTFTITAPTSPTWYYITVADASQVGDGGDTPTLTATCQTSDSLVGVQGNTYIGAIQAIAAGGSTNVLAGGWPAPQSVQVG